MTSVLDILARGGVPYRLHQHQPLVSVDDYTGNTQFPVERMIKTLCFGAGSGWFLPVLRALDRLDYAAAARAAGVRRPDLRLADTTAFGNATGWQPGGYAPFAVRADMRVVFDLRVLTLPIVFCGSGRADLTLEIATADLFALVQAEFAQLAKP
ncbi:MAG: hypothetical protein DCC58_02420 [Chloroflexi bacterium]|nr:MAG: hypothetical protein DCC58_02420 [Chloroflexota bacterium]